MRLTVVYLVLAYVIVDDSNPPVHRMAEMRPVLL